jgi:hypothetical protein
MCYEQKLNAITRLIILVTILGENYLDFINQETGEWE